MDENARQAIRKRRMLEEIERKLEYRIAELQAKYKESGVKLKELEVKLIAAKNKRKILLGTDSKASSSKSAVTASTGFTAPKSSPEPYETFMRMEERINDEREVSSLRVSKEQEPYEKEEKLIDEELQNIKKQMKGGKK